MLGPALLLHLSMAPAHAGSVASPTPVAMLGDDGLPALSPITSDVTVLVESGWASITFEHVFENLSPADVRAHLSHPIPVGLEPLAVDIDWQSDRGWVPVHGSQDWSAEDSSVTADTYASTGESRVRVRILAEGPVERTPEHSTLTLALTSTHHSPVDQSLVVTLDEATAVRDLITSTPMTLRGMWSNQALARSVGPLGAQAGLAWLVRRSEAPLVRAAVEGKNAALTLEPPTGARGTWGDIDVDWGGRVGEVRIGDQGDTRQILARAEQRLDRPMRVRGSFAGERFDVSVLPRATSTLRAVAGAWPPVPSPPAASRHGTEPSSVESGARGPKRVPRDAAQARPAPPDHQRMLAYCFAQRRRDNPRISGRVEVAMVVVDGVTTSAHVEYNDTGDAGLTRCIETRLLHARERAGQTFFARLPYTVAP